MVNNYTDVKKLKAALLKPLNCKVMWSHLGKNGWRRKGWAKWGHILPSSDRYLSIKEVLKLWYTVVSADKAFSLLCLDRS